MNSDLPAGQWEGRDAAAWQSDWRVPAVHLFQRVSSTSDVAQRLAEAGAAAGTTVITDEQTAGRGQAGRTWTAAPGQSLLLSVLLRADSGVDPGSAPLRVGLAAATAIEDATGLDVCIKWPNDLLLHDGGKLAGLLCEAASGTGGTRIVAGIGINVLQAAHDFPADLRQRAVSLHMAGSVTARATLVRAILDRLRPFHVPPPPLDARTLQALAARDALRGHQVDIDGTTAGVALGIAADGCLIVRAGDRARRVRSGSVRRTRSPDAADTVAGQPTGNEHGSRQTRRAETPR